MTIKIGGSTVPSLPAGVRPVDVPAPPPARPPAAGTPGDAFDAPRSDYGTRLGGPLALTNGDDDGTAGSGSSTSSTAAAALDRAKLGKDDQQRLDLIDKMGAANQPPLSDDERKQLLSAFRSMSVAQIKQAAKTGVTIWRGHDLPADSLYPLGKDSKLSSAAQYVPGARVLMMNPDNPPTTSQLTHELGHLRDDMLDDPKAFKKPLAQYKEGKERDKMFEKVFTVATEGDTKYKTFAPGDGGKLESKKMTLDAMYKAYVKRSDGYLKDDLFHSPTQANTYARKNPQEFFAEAFEVFHGNDPAMQAKLKDEAPEIYYFLKADAKANGLPLPDEKAMAAAAAAAQTP